MRSLCTVLDALLGAVFCEGSAQAKSLTTGLSAFLCPVLSSFLGAVFCEGSSKITLCSAQCCIVHRAVIRSSLVCTGFYTEFTCVHFWLKICMDLGCR